MSRIKVFLGGYINYTNAQNLNCRAVAEYLDKDKFPHGPWCKVKDWVVFARYAGSRIEIEGGEVRLLNDDEILATVQDPTDILHKF